MQKRSIGRIATVVAGVLVVCAVGPGVGARSGDSWQRSLAMCTDDFDEDGVPDIVVGFAGSSGGGLMLLRGNVDAIHPNTLEARARF